MSDPPRIVQIVTYVTKIHQVIFFTVLTSVGSNEEIVLGKWKREFGKWNALAL